MKISKIVFNSNYNNINNILIIILSIKINLPNYKYIIIIIK